MKTLTKNWRDHGGQAHEHTHGNKIEIFQCDVTVWGGLKANQPTAHLTSTYQKREMKWPSSQSVLGWHDKRNNPLAVVCFLQLVLQNL